MITYHPSGPHVVHEGIIRWVGRQQVTKDGANVATYAYDDHTGWVTLAHANGVTTVYEVDPLYQILRVFTAKPLRSSPTTATATTNWNPRMQRWDEHADHPANVATTGWSRPAVKVRTA